jgi:hypothetical protein
MMPVRKMPSKTPAPPMERTTGLVRCSSRGDKAGRIPGVRRLNRSAPISVPRVPLM